MSYSCGVVGSDFVLAPGRITIIGAPPGTGKTALASQIVFDALVENPDLRLWIANCEMGIETLLRREIARVSGVGHKRILEATFTKEEHGRILEAAEGMVSTISRVHHMIPPFDCESLHKLILEPTPGILVVDYLQKFRSADREARTGVDEVISVLRGLALQGWAILAMSSTARQQGGRNGGHNHQTLSMSSFKESGEIEFNADAAYILRDATEGQSKVRDIDLDCVKNRNGSLHKIELRFCGDFMRFESRVPERYSEFDDYSESATEAGF